MSFTALIVDDAGFVREILKNLCEATGIVVVGEASHGQEAVEMAQSLRPSLIFMDLVMPHMNGVEATQKIKEIYPEAKIISCTTISEAKILEQAKIAGSEFQLLKPFTRREFQQLIQNIVQIQKEVKHA